MQEGFLFHLKIEMQLLRVPVLFLVFNRPELTARSFQRIRSAQPSRLYIGGDGPRVERGLIEAEKVEKTRQEVLDAVDWPCEVKCLFQEENRGCARAVSQAISWFFENESMGIILEDDCLAENDFFSFSSEMLSKYSEERKVGSISGDCFARDYSCPDFSYFFSKYFHCWGWATWRDRWQAFIEETGFPERLNLSDLSAGLDELQDGNQFFPAHWKRIEKSCRTGKVDSWAYPFLLYSFSKGLKHIHPVRNLVVNIGFGGDSTHTSKVPRNLSIPNTQVTNDLFPLRHPDRIQRDMRADQSVDKNHFGINAVGWMRNLPHRLFSLIPRKEPGIK